MSFIQKMRDRARPVGSTETWIKMALYGEGGTGKTTFAGTMPNLLLINAEGGDLALKTPHYDCIDANRITTVDVDNFIDFNDYYEFLLTHCNLRDQLLREVDEKKINDLKDKIWSLENSEPRGDQEPLLYYSVALDSITEIQKKSLDRIIDTKHGEASSGSFDTNINFEVPGATLPDYGANTNQMRKLLRAFRDLPMHVLFIALEDNIKNEDTGVSSVAPSLTPKLSVEIQGLVDIMGRSFVHVDEDGVPAVKILFQKYSNILAKDRSGKLGMGGTNITFPEMYDKITK